MIKKAFFGMVMMFFYHGTFGQAQITTTGNNVIDTSNPYAADIVIGSDANGGIRHDASIMWWSSGSASRISNSNDVFYFSPWNTTNANVALAATVGGSSYFQSNVGIGTTNPTAALDIANISSDLYNFRVTGGYTNFNSTTLRSTYGTSGHLWDVVYGDITNFSYYNGAGWTTPLSFDNSGNFNAAGNLTVSGSGPNYFTGNMGIGATNPTSRLQITENSGSDPGGVVAATKSVLKLSRWGTPDYSYPESAEFRIGHGGPSVWGSQLDLFVDGGSNTSDVPDQQVMTWLYNGNVGIGTTIPAAKLDVENGTALVNTDALSALGGQVTISNNYGNLNGAVRLNFNNGGAVSWIKGIVTGPNTNTGSAMVFGVPSTTSDGAEAMRITANGSLAIGTTNPKSFMLAVAGPAVATSMTVQLQANWPDYVFKPNYTLPSLTEVKTYIDKNQHLPEMPSGEEVAEKGLNLGEMNKLLVKKVEELTLYLIEKDKQLIDQQNQLKAQQAQIEASKQISEIQSSRIQKIENDLNTVLNKIKTAR